MDRLRLIYKTTPVSTPTCGLTTELAREIVALIRGSTDRYWGIRGNPRFPKPAPLPLAEFSNRLLEMLTNCREY